LTRELVVYLNSVKVYRKQLKKVFLFIVLKVVRCAL